jgi:REP element-mobilizing transposase RayT
MCEYPERLHHRTPHWVAANSVFHIRIRLDPDNPRPLTDLEVSAGLRAAARRYHESGQWGCLLFLLMPDHLHALLQFPLHPGMSEVIRNWKRGATRFQQVAWQENFFDHRLRNRDEVMKKWHYIQLNPVVKGLCQSPEQWPHKVECVDPNALGASEAR